MFKVAFFILPTSTRLYAGESNNMNDNKNEITSSNLQVVKIIIKINIILRNYLPLSLDE